MPRLAAVLLLAALLPALGGCVVVTVVGAGVSVASAAVGAGVSVGKGVVHALSDDDDQPKPK